MLQFITNAVDSREIVNQVRAVIDGGCRWVQLRMKDATKADVVSVAKELKPICGERECILVIDDYVDIAKELELDGVHLGKNDMNPIEARNILGGKPIIGVTANSYEDIECYSCVDIDYIGLGPYRFTTTKKNLSPILGIDKYKNIMQRCVENGIFIPVVAIGGIEYDDIDAIMSAGVHGIAVSGALVKADNMVEATCAMIDKLKAISAQRLETK